MRRVVLTLLAIALVFAGAAGGWRLSQPTANSVLSASMVSQKTPTEVNQPSHQRQLNSQNSDHHTKHPLAHTVTAMSVSLPATNSETRALEGSAPVTPSVLPVVTGKPVTILFFYGGGWNAGRAADIRPLANRFIAMGYRGLAVPYRETVGDNIIRQVAYARKVVSDVRTQYPGGAVLAYGVSAGGTIAADLAAAGEVDGAVVVIAPTDLPNWHAGSPYYSTPKHWSDLGMTATDLVLASPMHLLGRKTAPEYLQYAEHDPIVPLDQGQRYFVAAKVVQSDTTQTVMQTGGHEYPATYALWAAKWIHDRWPPN